MVGQPRSIPPILFPKLEPSEIARRYDSSVHGTDGLTSPPKDGILNGSFYPRLYGQCGDIWPTIPFSASFPNLHLNPGPIAPAKI